MSYTKIDQTLSAWRTRLDSLAQNLIDLRCYPAYERLRTADYSLETRLTGETALQAAPALEAMSRLFEYFELLKHTIERAEETRRNTTSIFGNGQSLHEIEGLLWGKSVHLPRLEEPLEKGTLLNGADVENLSPEELFHIIVVAHQAAKESIEAVGAAWKRLESECDQAAIEIGLLGTSPQLVDAEEALRQLRTSAIADPLGAATRFDTSVRPAITRARAAIEAQVATRKQIEEGFVSGHRQLTELTVLHSRAEAACQERLEKIAGVSPRPLPDAAKIEGLRDWLARLETKYAGGLFEPILVGLRNWQSAAQQVSTAEQACLNENRAPLDVRYELRGRFDALKAKARALALAENPTCMELARKADRILYSRPTALQDAESAVASYEAMLTRSSKQSGT